MIGRGTVAALAAILLAASLSACAGTEGVDPKLRHAKSTATLEPDDGYARGDVVVAGSTALFLDDTEENGFLTAFDLASGTETWTVSAVGTGPVWVGAEFVVFGVENRRLEVRDLKTGERRYDIVLKAENLSGDRGYLAGAANGVILVVNPEGDRRQVLSGLDPKTGDELWTYKPQDADDFAAVQPIGVDFGTYTGTRFGGPGSLRLASDAPVVTVANSDRPYEAIGLDVETGDERWKVETGGVHGIPWMDWSGDGIASAVTKASESSEERTLTAVDAESGKREVIDVRLAEYNVKLDRWDPLGEEHPGVRVAEGFAFVQDGDFRPQVVDLRTGKPVWTAEHSGVPLVYGNGVAVYQSLSSKGLKSVYAVDVESGEKLWRSEEKVDPDLNSVIVDGQLLVSGKDGTEVYDVKTGEGLWRFRGKLLGWNGEHYVFKKTENDKSVKVVERDGR